MLEDFGLVNLFLCKVLSLKEAIEIKGREQLVDIEDHQVQNIYVQRSSQTSLNWSTQDHLVFFSVIYQNHLNARIKVFLQHLNMPILKNWILEKNPEMWTCSLKETLAFVHHHLRLSTRNTLKLYAMDTSFYSSRSPRITQHCKMIT